MKPTLNLNRTHLAAVAASSLGRFSALLALLLAFAPALGLRAADIYWTNVGPATAYWTTANNWDPATVPTSTDNAVVGHGDSSYAYIDIANSANPIVVGSITLSPNRTLGNLVLRQQSSSAPIVVHGLNGILITNASTVKRLQIAQGGVTAPTVYLAGNGDIGVPVGIEMLFYTGIRETNGAYGFTKTGPGKLTLQAPAGNLHTGPTTIKEGTIDLRLSTARLGPGPIVFAGGTLLCAADRSGVTPQASPVIVTADSVIQDNGTSTSAPRIFPFSGTFGGDTGSLTIENVGVAGHTFIVRLTGGGFTFTRPIILKAQTLGALIVLQLQNPASAGTQTFTGQISSYYPGDPCSVQRTGADGTTIFTAANTYDGGTLISQGTLLANNTTGSALGSGMATVTNLGVLGGNGFVASATVNKGGTISPGVSATGLGNLAVNSLTFGEGATYVWQIGAATGTAGVNWDLLTVESWSDVASSANPITIKVDSRGVTPTGWNPTTARDWVILQPNGNYGFNAANFALDTTAFSGSVQGIFALYADASGAVHLSYTPAADIVINVPSGMQSQADAGYAVLTGANGVAKIGNGELVVDNSSNDYQGSTKVLAGMLSISVDAAIGFGALGVSPTATYVGNTTGDSNATFNINTSGVTMSRDLVVQAGSSGTKTIGTTITSGAVSYLGDITLQDSAVLNAPQGSSITFSGDFSGDGGITLTGGGAFTMSGIGTYKGPTVVNTPLLNLNGPAFGTNTITFETAVTGLTLDNTSGNPVVLNTARQNWNGDVEFIGSGSLNLGAGQVTLNGDRTVDVEAGTLVVGGRITGNGSLTKTGPGTLFLASSGANSYTGGTTNLEGVLAVNGAATFGNGAGPLVLDGGSLLCTDNHATTPHTNAIILSQESLIVGTNTASITAAFSGPISNPRTHKLTIANKGWNTTTFSVRLLDSGNINWPIVVGDPVHDRPAGGVTNQVQFYSTNSTPQIVSGLISGPVGEIVRGNVTPNTGGATIFTEQNTVARAHLTGGGIGFGASSVSSAGVITSGPIGTGLFTIGNQTTAETNMTVFAYGGPRVIDNPIFLNGAQNVVMTGTNDLAFAGAITAGGIPKTWTVRESGVLTLAGQITSSGEGAPLTKAGVGTLVLSGENLYTGATTVAAGTLLANNTTGSATGPNNITVRSEATLGGTGTVAGRVTLTSGSIAPGQSAGTLTVGGGVNLSSGGTYVWDLAANSTNGPGSNFDVLAVTGGSVVLDGTSQLLLNFIGSATAPDAANPFWQTNHSWVILTVGGSASNPGPTQFATIVNGTYSAGTFANTADAGGNIVLTFTPGLVPPPQPVISSTIDGAGTANPTLSWSTESGYPYRLQYKTNLNQADWLVVGDVTATGSTASMTHTNSLWPQCYYRVIVP